MSEVTQQSRNSNLCLSSDAWVFLCYHAVFPTRLAFKLMGSFNIVQSEFQRATTCNLLKMEGTLGRQSLNLLILQVRKLWFREERHLISIKATTGTHSS